MEPALAASATSLPFRHCIFAALEKLRERCIAPPLDPPAGVSTGGGGGGDQQWVCQVCGNPNHGSRNACFMQVCAAPRGFPGPYPRPLRTLPLPTSPDAPPQKSETGVRPSGHRTTPPAARPTPSRHHQHAPVVYETIPLTAASPPTPMPFPPSGSLVGGAKHLFPLPQGGSAVLAPVPTYPGGGIPSNATPFAHHQQHHAQQQHPTLVTLPGSGEPFITYSAVVPQSAAVDTCGGPMGGFLTPVGGPFQPTFANQAPPPTTMYAVPHHQHGFSAAAPQQPAAGPVVYLAPPQYAQ